ncbi:thiol-disulfide oxidoreductase [Gracilibacillus halophilus YIM-C55.5]|uniref:Thiol-disulfide oxidoreductase n=1 Tax=Gracilibacillus halophilus YIM-C55.5 TaxID=1308866 RepID=N4WWB8_9BACI|nr:thiol-disulfide oxidoreductase ResA [Gracilibacillus halophilus]ENH97376.1 thiol-disulfide oxidoreductase [Gracilibacillus halophilus YIM-C55.5]
MQKVEQATQQKRRKKQKRMLIRSAILVVLFGATLFAVIASLTEEQAAVKDGDHAPNFQLNLLNGNQDSIQLEELRGKGVMVNFWATYCKPCKKEMPYMQSLYEEYQDRGIEILAVSVDSTEFVVNNFVSEYGLTFPILHDKNGEVMDAYGIKPLPASLFIDEDGQIVERVLGPLSLEKLEGYFQQIEPSQQSQNDGNEG